MCTHAHRRLWLLEVAVSFWLGRTTFAVHCPQTCGHIPGQTVYHLKAESTEGSPYMLCPAGLELQARLNQAIQHASLPCSCKELASRYARVRCNHHKDSIWQEAFWYNGIHIWHAKRCLKQSCSQQFASTLCGRVIGMLGCTIPGNKACTCGNQSVM